MCKNRIEMTFVPCSEIYSLRETKERNEPHRSNGTDLCFISYFFNMQAAVPHTKKMMDGLTDR